MAEKSLLNFEIHGAKELHDTLLKMEQKTQERILRRTIRLSMQPLRDSLGIAIVSRLTTMNARSRAFYAKQLRVVTKINRRNGSIKAYVITSRKELLKEINAIKKTGDSESANALNKIRGFGPLAHLYEVGVKPHKIKQLYRFCNICHRIRELGLKDQHRINH